MKASYTLLFMLLFVLSSCFKTDVDPSAVLLKTGTEGEQYVIEYTTDLTMGYIDLTSTKYGAYTASSLTMPFSGCVNHISIYIDNTVNNTGGYLYFSIDNHFLNDTQIDFASIGATVTTFNFELNEKFYAGERLLFYIDTVPTQAFFFRGTITIGNCE